MKVDEFIPSDILKPFIKVYRIIESQDEMTNRVLPNTSLAIAFRYKGQVSYVSDNEQEQLPVSTISGLRKSVRLIHYWKNSATIVVLFKVAGAKAFFKQPIYELFEESVPLDNFVSENEIAIIEEHLATAYDNKQRIAIIENFLLSKLINHKSDKLISIALEKINLENGNIRIKKLANSLYISNDAFEKRFRNEIGTSAKRFSSIVKMNVIIHQNPTPTSIIGTALSNGFYDQAHFNKDFKLFTGQTPTTFLKSNLYW